MRKTVFVLFLLAISIIYIFSVNLIVPDPIYYYYIHPDDFNREGHISRYASRKNIIIKDDKFSVDTRVSCYLCLQYDTLNVYSGNKLDYNILDVEIINSMQLEYLKIKDLSLEYLEKKIEEEFRKWELYVEFNKEISFFETDKRCFYFSVIFTSLNE